MIREGYSAAAGRIASGNHATARQWLSDLEAQGARGNRHQERCASSYNRVFGYYIEVTKSYYDLVPLRYQRRQTLASSERFTTDELRQIESKITGAQEQSTAPGAGSCSTPSAVKIAAAHASPSGHGQRAQDAGRAAVLGARGAVKTIMFAPRSPTTAALDHPRWPPPGGGAHAIGQSVCAQRH